MLENLLILSIGLRRSAVAFCAAWYASRPPVARPCSAARSRST